MHSEHYPHPEFGWLSPTARLRRELRTAFFSALFGIGIGAAAMVALNGNGIRAGIAWGERRRCRGHNGKAARRRAGE
jgi:hypothetical protein